MYKSEDFFFTSALDGGEFHIVRHLDAGRRFFPISDICIATILTFLMPEN
jgi:hypothetical protein